VNNDGGIVSDGFAVKNDPLVGSVPPRVANTGTNAVLQALVDLGFQFGSDESVEQNVWVQFQRQSVVFDLVTQVELFAQYSLGCATAAEDVANEAKEACETCWPLFWHRRMMELNRLLQEERYLESGGDPTKRFMPWNTHPAMLAYEVEHLVRVDEEPYPTPMKPTFEPAYGIVQRGADLWPLPHSRRAANFVLGSTEENRTITGALCDALAGQSVAKTFMHEKKKTWMTKRIAMPLYATSVKSKTQTRILIGTIARRGNAQMVPMVGSDCGNG